MSETTTDLSRPESAPSVLKACPFCGGPARVFQKYLDPKPSNWRVCCDNEDPVRGELCSFGQLVGDFETEAEAIAAWNRRSGPNTQMLEALKELVAAEKDVTDFENGDLDEDADGERTDPYKIYERIDAARLAASAAINSAESE